MVPEVVVLLPLSALLGGKGPVAPVGPPWGAGVGGSVGLAGDDAFCGSQHVHSVCPCLFFVLFLEPVRDTDMADPIPRHHEEHKDINNATTKNTINATLAPLDAI
jgi:hypothetical protein